MNESNKELKRDEAQKDPGNRPDATPEGSKKAKAKESEVLIGGQYLAPEVDAQLSAMKNTQKNEHTPLVRPKRDGPHERNAVEPAVFDKEAEARGPGIRVEIPSKKASTEDKGKEGSTGKTTTDDKGKDSSTGKSDTKDKGEVGSTDKQSPITEKEQIRREELMEEVNSQFRASGPRYHFKDQTQKVAFKDNGTRIVSASNDDRVAKAMVTLAEAKGWETIKVSGHPDFKREVWMEASVRGIEVRGFKPTEQDLKLLESRRDRTMRNTVEQIETGREQKAPGPQKEPEDLKTKREQKQLHPQKQPEDVKTKSELTPKDLKQPESERDRTMRNTVEHIETGREQKAPRPQKEPEEVKTKSEQKAPGPQKEPEEVKTKSEQKAPGPQKEPEEVKTKSEQTPKEVKVSSQHVKEETPTPVQKVEQTKELKPLRLHEGLVLEHGEANFQNDPDEKKNYFVRLATDKGEKTVWGIDLKRAMSEGNVKTGDDVKVEFKGSTPVTVEALMRDRDGKVIGKEEVPGYRNTWNIEKSDKAVVVEAVASVLIDAKVKDSALRDALKEAIVERLHAREQLNRVPAVPLYDKSAPARSQPERTEPVIERTPERTR